jgi:hypothetical protein
MFSGSAGQSVLVLVDPGSGNVLPPKPFRSELLS